MPDRVLRLPDVKRRVGMGTTWIYQQIARGDFPQPVKIGLRASGWVESEIDEWLKARAAARSNAA